MERRLLRVLCRCGERSRREELGGERGFAAGWKAGLDGLGWSSASEVVCRQGRGKELEGKRSERGSCRRSTGHSEVPREESLRSLSPSPFSFQGDSRND